MAIKAQVLVNFIVKFTHDIALDPDPDITKKRENRGGDIIRWNYSCMDYPTNTVATLALYFKPLSREQMEYTILIGLRSTNNEAEYEALLAGLRIAIELEVEVLDI